METRPPIKVLHVITALDVGGAETVLCQLLAAQDRREFPGRVVSLTSAGAMAGRISDLGIPVHALGARPGVADPRLVTRLRGLMLADRPDLVQTWMYHADLVGGLAARLAGSPPVVWGLHHSLAAPGDLKPATYAVARLNARLSRRLPARIVCCAESTRLTHLRLGYAGERLVVIPNGVDPSRFRPDPAARREVRAELGLADRTPLIGLCARFDPQKDHANFLRAAGLLHAVRPEAHFLLWGRGVETANPDLRGWMEAAGVGACTHLLGLRTDSPRLMAALDLGGLSSAYGEAMPLAVAEAMASAVPCAVTDIGDSAALVGPTGRVVPPRNPAALAGAWGDLLALPAGERRSLGARARRRILEGYSLEAMTAAYGRLYRDIIAGGAVP